MTALYALASALLVGGADFVGGLASRRSPAVAVALVVQVIGLAISVPLALVWGWEAVGTRDIVLSIASGVFAGSGIACFYAGMAAGTISLVAPVAAVTGAVLPVVVGLVRDEPPAAAALVGILLALTAVTVVSLAPDESGAGGARLRSIRLAIAAGFGFGLFYVTFGAISEDSGMWPTAIERVGSLSVLALVAPLLRVPLVGVRRLARPALAIAALELAGTVLLLLALQRGPLAIASVLASLYPVTTVVLAGVVLGERLSRLQLAGVGLALVSVVLIASG